MLLRGGQREDVEMLIKFGTIKGAADLGKSSSVEWRR